MVVFQASDILEFAMRIEENGASFYRYAVVFMSNPEAKSLFERLAREEDKHKEHFASLFRDVEKEPLSESYAGEYGEYLRNYVDNNIIFNGTAMEAEMKQIKDKLGAIDFAIRRELDSIAYYQEIKLLVPANKHGVIDAIITEEQRHFMLLSEVKAKL